MFNVCNERLIYTSIISYFSTNASYRPIHRYTPHQHLAFPRSDHFNPFNRTLFDRGKCLPSARWRKHTESLGSPYSPSTTPARADSSQMSMHFAPQWVKPIKPSGTTITPTTETPAPPRPSLSLNSSAAPPNSNIPFPALSQNHSQGAQHPPPNNPALSYSRITHTLISPAVPNDYSYFPHPEQNGTDPNPHPFRYSREQILALWDEDKVKNTPIELKEMLNGVLVSKSLVKPVGLRDINEVEKKASWSR